jgi:hypothetical protein
VAPTVPLLKKCRDCHSGRLRFAENPSSFSPIEASAPERLRRFSKPANRLAVAA